MNEPNVTPAAVLDAVKASGGWTGRFATRYGLYKQLVYGWRKRDAVPRPWRLILAPKLTKIVTS